MKWVCDDSMITYDNQCYWHHVVYHTISFWELIKSYNNNCFITEKNNILIMIFIGLYRCIGSNQRNTHTIFMDWVIFWMFRTDLRRMPMILRLAIPLCCWHCRFLQYNKWYNSIDRYDRIAQDTSSTISHVFRGRGVKGGITPWLKDLKGGSTPPPWASALNGMLILHICQGNK